MKAENNYDQVMSWLTTELRLNTIKEIRRIGNFSFDYADSLFESWTDALLRRAKENRVHPHEVQSLSQATSRDLAHRMLRETKGGTFKSNAESSTDKALEKHRRKQQKRQTQLGAITPSIKTSKRKQLPPLGEAKTADSLNEISTLANNGLREPYGSLAARLSNINLTENFGSIELLKLELLALIMKFDAGMPPLNQVLMADSITQDQLLQKRTSLIGDVNSFFQRLVNKLDFALQSWEHHDEASRIIDEFGAICKKLVE